mmetsp:Transcript_21544/g.38402  ORF Transcript_21544/g.38402 Transcript_21544/m.38402 type:complete len:262 (-) Transcript_21544:1599-2384(-)
MKGRVGAMPSTVSNLDCEVLAVVAHCEVNLDTAVSGDGVHLVGNAHGEEAHHDLALQRSQQARVVAHRSLCCLQRLPADVIWQHQSCLLRLALPQLVGHHLNVDEPHLVLHREFLNVHIGEASAEAVEHVHRKPLQHANPPHGLHCRKPVHLGQVQSQEKRQLLEQCRPWRVVKACKGENEARELPRWQVHEVSVHVLLHRLEQVGVEVPQVRIARQKVGHVQPRKLFDPLARLCPHPRQHPGDIVVHCLVSFRGAPYNVS